MSEKRYELLDAVDHACLQIIHMAKPFRKKDNAVKKFGVPIKAFGPEPLTEERSGHPAFGWNLSPEAKCEIEEIDRNARTALQRIGHIIVG